MSPQRLPGFTAELSLGQPATHYHTTGASGVALAGVAPQGFWDDVWSVVQGVGETVLGLLETVPIIGNTVQYVDCTARCIIAGGNVADCAQGCSPLGVS